MLPNICTFKACRYVCKHFLQVRLFDMGACVNPLPPWFKAEAHQKLAWSLTVVGLTLALYCKYLRIRCYAPSLVDGSALLSHINPPNVSEA